MIRGHLGLHGWVITVSLWHWLSVWLKTLFVFDTVHQANWIRNGITDMMILLLKLGGLVIELLILIWLVQNWSSKHFGVLMGVAHWLGRSWHHVWWSLVWIAELVGRWVTIVLHGLELRRRHMLRHWLWEHVLTMAVIVSWHLVWSVHSTRWWHVGILLPHRRLHRLSHLQHSLLLFTTLVG